MAVAQLKLEKGKLENDKDAIQSAQDSIERIKMRSGEAEATDNTETETPQESAKYIGESVSDKFRQLMAERLK